MTEMTLEERVERLEAIAVRDAKTSADLADFCGRLNRAFFNSPSAHLAFEKVMSSIEQTPESR